MRHTDQTHSSRSADVEEAGEEVESTCLGTLSLTVCLNMGELERGDVGEQQGTEMAADVTTSKDPSLLLSVPPPSGELRFPW